VIIRTLLAACVLCLTPQLAIAAEPITYSNNVDEQLIQLYQDLDEAQALGDDTLAMIIQERIDMLTRKSAPSMRMMGGGNGNGPPEPNAE